jgi:hypothetical protein
MRLSRTHHSHSLGAFSDLLTASGERVPLVWCSYRSQFRARSLANWASLPMRLRMADLKSTAEKFVQRLATGPTVAYGKIKALLRACSTGGVGAADGSMRKSPLDSLTPRTSASSSNADTILPSSTYPTPGTGCAWPLPSAPAGYVMRNRRVSQPGISSTGLPATVRA